MAIIIDGGEVLRVADRGLVGRFAGLQITNEGGEYGIRRVAVHGVPL